MSSAQFAMNLDFQQMFFHLRPRPLYTPDTMEQLENTYDNGNLGANDFAYEFNINAATMNGTIADATNTREEMVDITYEVPGAGSEVLAPVFREGGIMYGILATRSPNGQKLYQMNPSVPKKPAKVFGDNNIAVGAWFANRLVALHRGAHGLNVGGICGTVGVGTYSIVVSAKYADLDEDNGDVLFYSGANSHNNLDPTRPAPSTAMTNTLKTSFHTRFPVRVLRSGRAGSRNYWAPECGLRYDGLYRVVALRLCVNARGGLYEQFVLHRDPDQISLETLRRVSPTVQEKLDLAEFKRE
ncbi:PUA-like domain-containing protein [Annulohypoxylon maeteangense]|uniref:PUA-like domain-containing protein n=1 Tax=Annulohypoxylon maeteangense TaxID=1927788 RepID=UPI002007C7E8|nr:PUA-like domain-containing protein [Annulohypoxylon maeteangense]KAI0883888.1 PUA-like domain-containing protein [Annulohypoxylon maeteangense]